VAFATILAVVSGLALAGASAISHDLYANVFRKGKSSEADEMKMSKIASIVLGIVAVLLGIVFEKQNVAFMVGLAFAIAASGNFPVLILSILWKGLTTRGALWGGYLGLGSAVVLTVLGPSMWVDTFHLAAKAAESPFPLKNPALVSMPLAFIVAWLVSKFDTSETAELDRAGYEAQEIRSETGLGAAGAAKH
jgi:cation/acetate symporter